MEPREYPIVKVMAVSTAPSKLWELFAGRILYAPAAFASRVFVSTRNNQMAYAVISTTMSIVKMALAALKSLIFPQI